MCLPGEGRRGWWKYSELDHEEYIKNQ